MNEATIYWHGDKPNPILGQEYDPSILPLLAGVSESLSIVHSLEQANRDDSTDPIPLDDQKKRLQQRIDTLLLHFPSFPIKDAISAHHSR